MDSGGNNEQRLDSPVIVQVRSTFSSTPFSFLCSPALFLEAVQPGQHRSRIALSVLNKRLSELERSQAENKQTSKLLNTQIKSALIPTLVRAILCQ